VDAPAPIDGIEAVDRALGGATTGAASTGGGFPWGTVLLLVVGGGVVWMVMKDAVEASKEQVEKFSHTMHHDTNRPVQPLNARPVLK